MAMSYYKNLKQYNPGARVPTPEEVQQLTTSPDYCAELEYINDSANSRKFWHVRAIKHEVLVKYGRIGTEGRRLLYGFNWEREAIDFFNKGVKEKLHKGYKYANVNPLIQNKISADAFKELMKIRKGISELQAIRKNLDVGKAVALLASHEKVDALTVAQDLFEPACCIDLLHYSEKLYDWRLKYSMHESRFGKL